MKIEPVALRELAESDMFSMTEVYVALNSAADTIDTLRIEADALRKDAERYRWIRNSSNPIATQTVGEFGDQELDEAIDYYLSDAIDGDKQALE